MAVMTVTVGPYTINVSAATAGGIADPTWGAFAANGRLKFFDALESSSLSGPSSAKLTAATGLPAFDQVDVEASAMIGKGDRVIIVQSGTGIFAGYMIAGELDIQANREGLLYRLMGPEWLWGPGDLRGGSHRPVYGQLRRKASADDVWAATPATVTPFADLITLGDEPTIFNPLGRKNMTLVDVTLTAAGALGRTFETPDRKVANVEATALWTKGRAARYLVTLFNDATATGITADWAAIETAQPALATAPLRHVDVTGMGLYEALKAVLAPDYFFEVTCRPTGPGTWGGFVLNIHRRSGGPTASFTMDARGVAMSAAVGNVVRIGALKSIEKSATKVRLIGKAVRHVKLRYWGGTTPTVISGDAPKTKLLLQHGWSKSEGDLNLYRITLPAGQDDCIELYGLEASGGALLTDWRDRYTTNGVQHDKYRHVFRLFSWNEGGELRNAAADAADLKPHYNLTAGSAGVAQAWVVPDLAEIADAKGFVTDPIYTSDYAGKYARKRRVPLDTAYPDGRLDSWRRVKPTLWIAAVPENAVAEPLVTAFTRVPTSYYRVDAERCAIWITADDLIEWRPLLHREDGAEADAPDGRNFATLLYMGKLRMLLELSVEVDLGLQVLADRGAGAGSPHVRETVVVATQDYVRSLSYADGVTSPSGMTAAAIDMLADAQALADGMRDAGQDEQIHASVMASADSGRQPIGSMILATSGGRAVSLESTAGRGAQIVAVRTDPASNKWEYLTESAAMEIRAYDRARVVNRRRHRERGRSPIPDQR